MASLDFVTDLREKLAKQNIEYGIITIQKGKQGNKIHIFYDIKDIESVACAAQGANDFIDILTKLTAEYEDEIPKLPKFNIKRKKKGGK